MLLSLTAVFVFLDQATKIYVAGKVSPDQPVIIFEDFLQITYVLNPGAAFGFLADKSSQLTHPFFVTVTSIAVIFIMYMYFTLKRDDILARLSLCMILSGAVGNLIDRFRIKAVIDFIYVHYYEHFWPAFNVADALITVGIALMIIDAVIRHKKEGISA